MLDHRILGATVVDGTGAPAYDGDLGVRDGRIVTIVPAGTLTEPAHHTLDADRPRRVPRLRRPAHALRRPALLGSVRHAVERARGHVGHRRQLQLRPRAVARRRRRLHAAHAREGRGHAARGVGAWRALDVGELRRVPRRARGQRRRERGFMLGHSALRRFVLGAEANRRAVDAGRTRAAARRARRRDGARARSASRPTCHTRTATATAIRCRRAAPTPTRSWPSAKRRAAGRVPRSRASSTARATGSATQSSSCCRRCRCAPNRPLNWNLLVVDAKDPSRIDRHLAVVAPRARAGWPRRRAHHAGRSCR